MDTLLDKFNELNRHRDSMSNVVVDTLNEIYDVTPQWLSELNDMHNIYGPKLNVRFRCLNYLFPVDIKEKSKKIVTFSNDLVNTSIDSTSEVYYSDGDEIFVEPQMRITTHKVQKNVPDHIVPVTVSLFCSVLGLYDLSFNTLQPLRTWVSRRLIYEPIPNTSLPSDYKGSLDGWLTWSSWIGSRNACDCALCSLKTFNCPSRFDVLVENDLKNGLSGAELLHRIYIQVLGAMHFDRMEDLEHKQTLIRLIEEAGVNAHDISGVNFAVTRERINSVERFLESLEDDTPVPHLCLNNPLLFNYLNSRPGWGLHMIAYIRICKELRLMRTYGPRSFQYKMMRNFFAQTNKKVFEFRTWVSENRTAIANIGVWSSLLVGFLGPHLYKYIKEKKLEKKKKSKSILQIRE